MQLAAGVNVVVRGAEVIAGAAVDMAVTVTVGLPAPVDVAINVVDGVDIVPIR